MSLGDREQLIEAPDLLGPGLGENPAATQAAQTIGLGQASGTDEGVAQTAASICNKGGDRRDCLRYGTRRADLKLSLRAR